MLSITKKHLNMLERLFAAEIEGRMYQPRQKRTENILHRYRADGLVEEIREYRHGLYVHGWVLSDFGRLVYCGKAAETEELSP